MRFIHAFSRASYVVKASTKTFNVMGQQETHRGLNAKFRNHSFDSEGTQREVGWTDDERKVVEDYLMSHRDFDHPRGFYVELADGETKTARRPATAGARRCIAMIRNERNESEQCPNLLTDADSDYCEEHAKVAAEAMEG